MTCARGMIFEFEGKLFYLLAEVFDKQLPPGLCDVAAYLIRYRVVQDAFLSIYLTMDIPCVALTIVDGKLEGIAAVGNVAYVTTQVFKKVVDIGKFVINLLTDTRDFAIAPR